MRNLYRSTSWRRVLALVLVFVMMFSVMGTSGYSVFAEGLEETGEAVVEPAAEEPAQEEEFTLQGESPGEEEAEAAVEAEEGDVEVEAVEEAEEEAEESAEEAVEEAVEDEEAEEPAEEAVEEEAEEGEELEAEPAEEAEEEAEEPAEEAAEEEETLIAEAAQVIIEDDGAEAPAEEEVAEAVEEEAIEELPEEDVIPEGPTSFPSKRFGDTVVSVSADPYTFPEGTTVEIKEVTLGRTQVAAIADVVEEEIVSFKAYDITFFDADGIEIQPVKPVKVNIESAKMADMDNLQVVHIEDNNKKATVIDDVDETKKGLEFDAEHFSVYVVVETGVEARALVKFMNGETEIASIYVKKGDIVDGKINNIVLYDPGVGDIADDVIFKGWAAASDYTAETKPLTIDDVRKAVAEIDWTAVVDADEENGTVITYYAMLFKASYVTYLNEFGIAVYTDEHLVRSDSTETAYNYTVSQDYTPDDPEISNFEGWAKYNTETEVMDTTAVYNKGQVIENLEGDLTLRAYCPSGRWISFREMKGSYTAPEFVETGNKSKGTVFDGHSEKADPTRFGYVFTGWYRGTEKTVVDEETGKETTEVTYGERYTFDQLLTESLTLYAGWEEADTANYTVIVWKESMFDTYADNVTGGQDKSYDFWKTYTLTGDYDSVIDAVKPASSSVTDHEGTYSNIRINGDLPGGGTINETISEQGYHYSKHDQNVKIVAEGTSVVNVYYDRNVITYTFYTKHASTRWILTTTQNGQTQFNGNIYTRNGNSNNYNQFNGTPTYGDGNTYYRRTGSWLWGYDYQQLYWNEVTVSGSGEWTVYQESIGLYSQKLDWPEDTSIWWYPELDWQGNVSGTRMTYKGAFLPMTATQYEVVYYGVEKPSGNKATINFYLETVGGDDWELGYSAEASTGYNGSQFNINDKFDGYKAHHYTVDNSSTEHQLGSANQNGVYATVDFTSKLNIYYTRYTDSIVFKDGKYFNGDGVDLEESAKAEPFSTTEPVPFGTNLEVYNDKNSTEYKQSVPTAYHSGYVFAGWYSDEACTQPYTFTTMPLGGIVVYAKWVKIQYRVFLHPNAGSGEDRDESLAYGDSKQSTSFRVNYGERISNGTSIYAERSNYELIAWYMDEACTEVFSFIAFTFNEQTVNGEEFNYTKEQSTELDQWGDETADLNKDENRFWITQCVNLYAKWRSKLEGADGISVVYSAAPGTDAPVDKNLYLDQALATAGAASTPPTGGEDELHFAYWVIQTWDDSIGENGGYKDTDKTVLPGETFTVSKDDAHQIILSYEDDGKTIKSATYTVQLRAEYAEPDESTPTHIYWYMNDGSDEPLHEDEIIAPDNHNLQINEAVAIQPAPTRENYQFLGWAKVETPAEISEEYYEQNLDENNLFLTYHEAVTSESGETTPASYTGKTKAGATVTATHVAADEIAPYEDLFAVWKYLGAKYDVKHYQQNVDNDDYTLFETDEDMEGLIGADTEAEANNYTGFHLKSDVVQEKIAADGSTVVEIYYDRNVWKVTYDYGTAPAGASTLPEEKPYKFGATVIVADAATAPGYTFSGWSRTEAFPMPDENVTITGTWTAKGDTPYKVEHYLQDLPTEGTTAPGYTLKDTEPFTGATDATATANPKTYEGFTLNEQVEGTLKSGKITVDPELVLKLYYDRNVWTVTYTYAEGSPADAPAVPDEQTYMYGASVPAAEVPTMEGYTFSGWTGEVATMPNNNVTVTGSWTKDEEPPVEPVTYTIIYHANYESKVASEGDEVVTAEDVTMIVTFNDVKGANEQKFSKTSPWANGNTTYTFNSWNTKADGSGTKFTPGEYDGTGAVVENAQQPVTNDGTASAVSTSARTLRAMIATTSNGGTLELWAQWDETTSGGGNPRPPKDPDPTDEPEEPIDDPDTPLAPAEEDPIEDEDTEIDDGDTPYAGYEEEPDESIDEEPTPFSPYTGDDRHTAAWGFVSLLSLAGIAVVARRRREEE